MIGNVPVPFGATSPQRSRFGVSVRKQYGADPHIRENRANMFRTGVLPAKEPSRRTTAKWFAGISGFFLLFALGALASEDDSGAGALWTLILGSVLAWCIYVLARKRSLVLPAVNPFDHDNMHRYFRETSESAALRHLSWDRDEDVYASAQFESFDIDMIPEVLCMPERPEGFGLDPFEWVLTIHSGQTQRGGTWLRFGVYRMHHIFANKRGLTYVQTEWNFVDDGFTSDGQHPSFRIIESNQWTWRTIENLRVGAHEFTIHTIGANRVPLPYVGRPDNLQHRDLYDQREPGAYDWYFNTTAGRRQRSGRHAGAGGGGAFGAPDPAGQAPPIVHDPVVRQIIEQIEQAQREAAIRFVNTVNSLRHEWEDKH